MSRLILVLSILFASCNAIAEPQAYGKLFFGTADAFRDNQASQYGIEYAFNKGVSQFDFQPFVGLLRTRHASHYLYTGFSRTSYFTHSERGLAFQLSFGPGLYLYGEGDDTDLGHVFELRTSAGLLWQFADKTQMGVHYSHLSNGSIAEINPGTELLTFTYELPF